MTLHLRDRHARLLLLHLVHRLGGRERQQQQWLPGQPAAASAGGAEGEAAGAAEEGGEAHHGGERDAEGHPRGLVDGAAAVRGGRHVFVDG